MSLQNLAACTVIYTSTNQVMHMQKVPPDWPDKIYHFLCVFVSLSTWKRYQASTVLSVSLSVLTTFSESDLGGMDPLSLFVKQILVQKAVVQVQNEHTSHLEGTQAL